jgi:hypothetical protein
MGAFIAGMGVIIAILIFMVVVGEKRFNAIYRRLKGECSKCINSACPDAIKCAHQYKYYDRDGNEDNKDSHVAKCVKCGKEIVIEE